VDLVGGVILRRAARHRRERLEKVPRPTRIALIVATAAGLIVGGRGVLAEAPKPRAVIELFTSQGCGKCPPADALLGRLAADPSLITLSFAVDYWDYLGWKDTAARPEFTQRQRAYSEVRGDRAVYTPQVVVDGRTHVVGSDRAAIDGAIADHRREAHTLTVDVDVETSSDALVVRVGDAPPAIGATRATLWLVRYDVLRTVPIGKGENSGRTVTYSHLVKSLQPIGVWKGRAVRIELPLQETVHDGGEGCAVLLQVESDNGPGAILGARLVDRPAS